MTGTAYIWPAAVVALEPAGVDDGVHPLIEHAPDALSLPGRGKIARITIYDKSHNRAHMTIDLGRTVSQGEVYMYLRTIEERQFRVRAEGGPTLASLARWTDSTKPAYTCFNGGLPHLHIRCGSYA